MSRLADYFVLVGYDHEKDRGGQSVGKIIQRFPEKDWDGCPSTLGIELFCQPSGWKLSQQRCPPEFFISVLTDMDADRHYCACLSFSESVSITMPSPDDDGDVDETENAISHQSLMFSPKCLVLVSRLDYFETFRNCLGIIYTSYVDRLDVQLEVLVGNIIGCVYVPPPGGPQIRFSIGAGDRQALQPRLSSSIPSSRNCVALLFHQLGIQNVLVLFCAALTDHKILFHSQSFSRLTDACQAIVVLHYPLKFSYVYIPILPAPLVEVLNSPTPFMAGIHSSLAEDTADLLDVIIVDLDGGSIKIPECVNIPMIPEPILSRTKKSIHMIVNIDLLNADLAYPPPPQKKSNNIEMKDKEMRAVFIRLFAELLIGYRTYLTVIRIHPEPFITFHKANFLSNRGYIEDDFLVRVLDCMAFGGFVTERGPPYRVCDIFDEIYANIQDMLNEEKSDPNKMMENIRDLAKQLYTNENPNPQPYVQKVPKPTEGAYSRIHQPQFPYLDWLHVQEVIDEGINKNSLKSKFSNIRPQQFRIVPIGPPATTLTERQRIVDNSARRLEVLRNCVNFIFENKISDGRIIFPAVLRALKSRVARTALTQELSYHIRSNRAMLEHQQFDLVVKLLNCALQNDSSMDENGVAAAILPLATSFCRKLCTGVIQFAYTCVQEHAVWGNLQFWEAAFYQDVQKQIRQLYAPQYEEHNVSKDGPHSPTSNELSINWNRGPSTTPDTKRRSGIRPREIGALEIAAEQLRVWPNLTSIQKEEMINNEESTVYSQAIHYANRMVYMRVPLDTKTNLKTYSDWESNSNSNITASLAESDSVDAESGFDETEISDVGNGVVKFVMRFVDKVCNDSQVTQDHIKALHTMIPGVVAMHIETLEGVHRESKRLPPIQKPKILKPTLLQGEEVIMDGLRVYLLPDGREEGTGGNFGGPSLLPAEGAVFLTNYRIIFKGIPCDALACEQVVVRYFPVSTMTKEKQIKLGYTLHIDQLPKEGVQIRSNVFQLMKLAFDEEVIPEDIDTFRKLSNKSRNPASVFQTFAFCGQVMIQPIPMHKHKEKNASLKNFAKKTLMKTARKAGIKPKQSARKQKYVLPTPPFQRRSMSPRSSAGSDSDSERPNSELFDDLSIVDELEFASSWTTDPNTIEKLLQRPGYHDYDRLGLNSLSSSHHSQEPKSEQFRISTVNANFSVCRSYPALLVVPLSVTDDSIKKLARTHRQYRFPVITWRHSRTKALLIRASGFHSRGLMGMLKHDTTSGSAGSETSSSIEQERYFSSLVAATPKGERTYHPSCSDSLTSLDSLMMAGINVPETPDMTRRALKTGSLQRIPKPKTTTSSRDSLDSITEDQLTPSASRSTILRRASNALRASGTWRSSILTLPRRTRSKGSWQTFGRIGSIKEKTRTSVDSSRSSQTSVLSDSRGDMINTSVQGFKRISLYVLGEKGQMKGIKMESFPKCDFIPVDFYEVRHVKTSFKKLMRACVPSCTPTADATFYKAVEESEWLLQVQNIMQLAGATVDLLDVQGSSVMICLEDGWDITTQVVSAAQVLLDPYYRTIEGFKSLIEKEWLSFGHRFTHRSNQTAANQASGFAPLFLQFLDVVHQIHNQFPLSFEFNQFFLKFLAYHYVSNRFRTFMMDNEFERFEAGWILEEKKPSKFDDTDEDGIFSYKHQSNPGMSVWDYIDKHHRRSPVFCNFMYSVHDQETVLRPYSNLANMKVWDYYIDEDLAHGPPYELETVQKELALNEDVTVEGTPSSRRVVNISFDNVQIQEPESFKVLLQEVHRIQTDLGHLQQKWRVIWDKLEGPSHDSMKRNASFSTQLVKSHGRSIHKRSTLEILVKGKMLGEAAKRFSQPHRFEKFTYTTPAYCDYCSQVLWGFLKTGMHCADCGYNCHEKCMSHVPKNCTKLKIVSESSNSSSNVSRAGGSETSSVTGGLTGVHPSYENFTSTNSNSEHRTLEGYLYKKGALLKGWKQRWFVLDSTRHQMRYYDSMEDPNCRGFIDLFDVQAVHPIKNVQGPVKSKTEENAAFELKTNKRLYHFIASDAKTAQEWIDKIHSFI